MTGSDWLDLAVLERRKYNLLSETMDLTKQLGETLDRSDEVSLRLVLSMRQDPILQLEEVKHAVGLKLESLAPEDRERAAALASGSPPGSAEEKSYAEEAGRCRRLLERVLELDRRINRRMAGKDSFYKAET